MMIGVALETTKDDWQQCLKHPSAFILALSLQVIAIPLLAFLLVLILPLDNEVKIGLLLISLCPGGVMSNFFSGKAKGNTALSSVLTLSSSLLIPFTLPLGLLAFATFYGELNSLMNSHSLMNISFFTALLIIPPLFIGYLLQQMPGEVGDKLVKPLKSFSFILVGVIIFIALYENWAIFVEKISTVFFAAFALNALLLTMGYWTGRLFKLPTNICRTVSIELGIQNATVAIAIIPALFPNQPSVLNVVAFWGVWHLIAGLLISHYWSRSENPPYLLRKLEK